MIFPNSNLPIDAQSWGREVTKQLSNLIDQVASNEVNNAARDNQLNSSIIAASAAATRAENAVQGLIDLGNSGSEYTINADNITAGTLAGVTFQYNDLSGTPIGYTFSDNTSIYISYATVPDTTADNIIKLQNGSFMLRGGSANSTTITGSAGGLIVDAVGSDNVGVTINATGTAGAILMNSSVGLKVPGVSQAIIGPAGGVYPTNGTQTGTANVIQDASSAILRRVSSARKYKLDIQDVDYGMNALNLRPRTWIDKTLYEENGNSFEGLVRIPGFVAEEVFEAGLEELVKFNEDGEVESLHYDRIVGALIPVLQKHQEDLVFLTNKITELEGRINGQ
nr:MAG TPA: Receptor recognition protein, Long tail, Helical sandwich, Tail fiber [Caudoviricetes sp.]